jgi:hypothetical protein
MRRTQIQLPDALYDRRDVSPASRKCLWRLPVIDAGGPVNISAKQIKEILVNEESMRGIPH